MMRVLVIFAHPVETSYCSALHQAVVATLTAQGHDVDDCDLYADDFDPRLSREERLNYHDLKINQRPVSSYIERLKKAEAIVIVTPVWNFGHPAILKGYFDRVFLPGVTFDLNNGRITTRLRNIKKLTTVTTYGATRLNAFLFADPPRKIVVRLLRTVMGPSVKINYLAHYNMNRSSVRSRETFLAKVTRHMERF